MVRFKTYAAVLTTLFLLISFNYQSFAQVSTIESPVNYQILSSEFDTIIDDEGYCVISGTTSPPGSMNYVNVYVGFSNKGQSANFNSANWQKVAELEAGVNDISLRYSPIGTNMYVIDSRKCVTHVKRPRVDHMFITTNQTTEKITISWASYIWQNSTDYCSTSEPYFRLYRNTVESVGGANWQLIQGWTKQKQKIDANVIPGTNYFYFLQVASDDNLSYFSKLSPPKLEYLYVELELNNYEPINFPKQGGTDFRHITCNTNWNVISHPDWITTSVNNNQLFITAAPTTRAFLLTGQVLISAGIDQPTTRLITVTLAPDHTIFDANFISPNTNVCQNEEIIIADQTNGNPNYWSWEFTPNTVTYINATDSNSQNPQVRMDAPGLYTVKLIAENSSSIDSSIFTDYITVNENPDLYLGADIEICSSETVTITANDSYSSYLWSDNSTDTSIVVTQPGEYWLQVSNGYGCYDSDSIIKMNTPPGWETIVSPNSTTLFGEIVFHDDTVQYGTFIGAFVNNECRGIEQATMDNNNKSIVTIIVNSQETEVVNFKLWNAELCQVYNSYSSCLSNSPNKIGVPPNYIPILFEKSDLLVQNAGVSNNRIVIGDSVYVECTVQNVGSGDAVNVNLGVFLSNDTLFDFGDIMLEDYQIGSLIPTDSIGLIMSIIIPQSIEKGPYYLLYCIDPSNSIDESDEGNNIIYKDILTISSPSLCENFGDGSDGVFTSGTINRDRDYYFEAINMVSGSEMNFSGSGCGSIYVSKNVLIDEGASINLRNLTYQSDGIINIGGFTKVISHSPHIISNGGAGQVGNYSWGGQGGSVGDGYPGGVVTGTNQPPWGVNYQMVFSPENGAGGLYPGGNGESRSGSYIGRYYPGGSTFMMHANAGGGAAGYQGLHSENIAFIVAGDINISGTINGMGENGGNGGSGGSSTGMYSYYPLESSKGGGGGAGGAGGHGSKIYIFSAGTVNLNTANININGGTGGNGGLGGYGNRQSSANAPVYSAEKGEKGGDGKDGIIEVSYIDQYQYQIAFEEDQLCTDSVYIDADIGDNFVYQWFLNNDSIVYGFPNLYASQNGIYKVVASDSNCMYISDNVLIKTYEPFDLLDPYDSIKLDEFKIIEQDYCISNFQWSNNIEGPSTVIVADNFSSNPDNLIVSTIINKCIISDSTQIIIDSVLTQLIPLKIGWNLISFYVNVENTLISDVFDQHIANINQIKSDSIIYYDPVNGYNQSISTLSNSLGYWVNCNSTDTLSITSGYSRKPINISLYSGWNTISFPYLSDLPINIISSQLGNDLIEINDGENAFSPNVPEGFNMLVNLIPNKGYLIYVSVDTQLIYY